MGKIFGISDLPVTIFTTPLQPVETPKPQVNDLYALQARKKIFTELGCDIFVNKKYGNVIKQVMRTTKK